MYNTVLLTCYVLQISTNAQLATVTAVRMLFVLTIMAASLVHVFLDTLETDLPVQVDIFCCKKGYQAAIPKVRYPETILFDCDIRV